MLGLCVLQITLPKVINAFLNAPFLSSVVIGQGFPEVNEDVTLLQQGFENILYSLGMIELGRGCQFMGDRY